MAIDGPLKVNVQFLRGTEPAIGPGKALVLDAIGRTGSISAAGRDLRMSYRRIWLLVDSLNHAWTQPVVETRVGGGKAGGAQLTAFGEQMLASYRDIEARMVAAAKGADFDWLVDALKPES
ncbi:LysR family transcriptional regulator [Sphingomonas sp. PP-CC-3A-396]|uniref:winged helix-turn-helix domain-containing protein n=1 Tax=Sphingomonas sp. PP-CC-3A-396 TaxID=2135655 RepID=UPI0010EAA09A|nr:LysR family transcriptional regulator [Sphingomonas sp. PP-CC-3A-396]TCQ03169.1 molybdate transport system regulatory protein [Sphingomonas sp. PP-CC-3A-396]